jgi:hypothetical protein
MVTVEDATTGVAVTNATVTLTATGGGDYWSGNLLHGTSIGMTVPSQYYAACNIGSFNNDDPTYITIAWTISAPGYQTETGSAPNLAYTGNASQCDAYDHDGR